jgi:hypothetical protein
MQVVRNYVEKKMHSDLRYGLCCKIVVESADVYDNASFNSSAVCDWAEVYPMQNNFVKSSPLVQPMNTKTFQALIGFKQAAH